MLSLNDVKKIFNLFQVNGIVTKSIVYGEGHINNTYLVTINHKGKQSDYILQLINDKIFHPVSKLMENYVSVTQFCRKEIIKRKGDPHRETINVIFTKNHKSYAKYQGRYCRLLEFIKDTKKCAILAAAKVIFLVTKVSPLRSDSWLNKIPLQQYIL